MAFDLFLPQPYFSPSDCYHRKEGFRLLSQKRRLQIVITEKKASDCYHGREASLNKGKLVTY